MKIEEFVHEGTWDETREIAQIVADSLGTGNPFCAYETLADAAANETFCDLLHGNTLRHLAPILKRLDEGSYIASMYMIMSIAQRAYQVGRASMMPEMIVKEDEC